MQHRTEEEVGLVDAKPGADVAELAFDEDAWRARCEDMAKTANHGCGLLYEIFCDRISASVDSALGELPAAHHERATAIAVEFGYATAAERAAHHNLDGFCSHGFPDNCCPLGCDDRDDGYFEESTFEIPDDEFDRMQEEAEAQAEYAHSQAERELAEQQAVASQLAPTAPGQSHPVLAQFHPDGAPARIGPHVTPAQMQPFAPALAPFFAGLRTALRHPSAASVPARESLQPHTVGRFIARLRKLFA